jgi:glycosyltransferase involved in cell wall biosynthesis
MNIAMMTRGYLPSPRPLDMIYAPIDLAIETAQGLVERGHDVTYFGPQGTHIPGVKVETLNLRPLVHGQKEFAELVGSSDKLMHYVPDLWDAKFAINMFERAKKGEFDLLHFHHPETAMSLATLYPEVPVAYTLHDPIYQWYRDLFDIYKSNNQHFISISENQRRDAPDLRFCGTVYNGVDPEKFTFSSTHEDYLLLAGRIVPEKGVKEAIEVAKQTKLRLLIVGPVYESNQEYFNQYVKPHLNDKILYLGFMEQEQLIKYYKKATAILMPIQWEEPFGLAMTEAMACGTPVIALRRGSVPEVVVDGKTGFICDHVQDMVDAVNKIDQINRRDCRKHVEQNFAVKNMIDGYEETFRAILRHEDATLPPARKVRKQLLRLPGQLQRKLKRAN